MSNQGRTDAGDEDNGGLAGLTAVADRALCRLGDRSVRFVRVSLDSSPAPSNRRRPPIHLGLALDRSGSMSADNRIVLARQGVAGALRLLTPDDSFALVAFDDEVDNVAVPARPATRDAVEAAIKAVNRLEPDGSTALHAGWRTAADALGGRPAGTVGRCLLLTDGLANVGPSSPGELAAEAARLAGEQRVVTSAIGIGAGYNDVLLRAMADASDGHAYHVSSPEELPAALALEVGDALSVVARGVELHVRPSEGVRVEVLGRFRSAWGQNRLAVALGDLVASQRLDVVLRLTLPRSFTLPDPSDSPSIEITALSGGEPCLVAPVRIAWTVADHLANDKQQRNRDVDHSVAEIYAAKARQDAADLHPRDRDAAVALLLATAAKIGRYAGSDAALRQLVAELSAEAETMRHHVDEMTRKQMTMAAYSSLKGRSRDGRSFRSPG